jgi:cobaltochelatase CobN
VQKTLGQGHIEPLALTIGRELRSRYLNPRWIKGMQKENYAGARAMSEFLENMWGWQVTTPKAIDKAKWEQTYAVYVEDQYGLELKAFFNQENPWAYQSMTARMLEAVRKDYWQADEKIRRKLAAEYALNVVTKGVACCDHTCNNPLLNQMVANIISMPGVLAPEVVEQFKLAVEKAAAKSLDAQVAERKELLARLNPGLGNMNPNTQPKAAQKPTPQESASAQDDAKTVEGYKMETLDTPDETTDLSSAGIQWAASLFVLLLMGLFYLGLRQRR